MERPTFIRWLREEDPVRLEALWARADAVRRRCVGDAVHLRGLVEFSNHCRRDCAYCGIRAGRTGLARYRMRSAEILDCARRARAWGLGTLVLQSGEDPGTRAGWLAGVIVRIKAETGLAVTLSVGERTPAEYAAWWRAGADRYLLRFETSNPRLFASIHPPRPGGGPDRLALLRVLRELGYEIGTGVMVGIPGQTAGDLAADLELLQDLDPDMIGLGPYVPHPGTPLGRAVAAPPPFDRETTTYKMLALARLACPHANIPSTTALATVNARAGRLLGLRRGANVVMPNLTPAPYRQMYAIYPAKAGTEATEAGALAAIREQILSLGRTVGEGPGATRRRS